MIISKIYLLCFLSLNWETGNYFANNNKCDVTCQNQGFVAETGLTEKTGS